MQVDAWFSHVMTFLKLLMHASFWAIVVRYLTCINIGGFIFWANLSKHFYLSGTKQTKEFLSLFLWNGLQIFHLPFPARKQVLYLLVHNFHSTISVSFVLFLSFFWYILSFFLCLHNGQYTFWNGYSFLSLKGSAQ